MSQVRPVHARLRAVVMTASLATTTMLTPVAAIAASTAAAAEPVPPLSRPELGPELGPGLAPAADDLSTWQRFVIYPRLEKGLAAQREGSHTLAVAQFERARQLAPQSVLTALYLAYAYRLAGDRTAATRVLEAQHQHSPESQQIAAAMAEDAPWTPPPVSAEEQARRDQAARDAERAQRDQQLRQALEDRIAAVRERIALGDLERAQSLAELTLPHDSALRASLDRDLAQRAIHLRREALALAAFERIDEAGQLTPADARQWLTLRLAGGDSRGARRLLARMPSRTADSVLAVARTLAQRGETEPLRDFLAGRVPVFDAAPQEAEWLRLLATAQAGDPGAVASFPLRFDSNRPLQAELALPALLASGRHDEAEALLARVPEGQWMEARLDLAEARGNSEAVARLGALWLQQQPGDLALLDRLSFRLVRLGRPQDAARLLIAQWPFESTAPAALPDEPAPTGEEPQIKEKLSREPPSRQAQTQRLQLIDRLIGLAEQAPALIPTSERPALARPLATTALRERQALLFSLLRDCRAIRGLLGDFSASYQVASWLRLAQCYRDTAPGLAQYAYGEALAREPSDQNRLALAYQAHATEDYRGANAIWKALGSEALTAEATLAAAASAAAAGDDAALSQWLTHYDEAGFSQGNDRYWWWQAHLAEKRAPNQALRAVKQAIAIRPLPDYYRLQAALQSGQGDHDGARDALQQALALNPGDRSLLEALAQAQAEAGRPREAAEILQQLDRSQPGDPAIARQLSYLYVQLGETDAAREKSRVVIDSLRVPAEQEARQGATQVGRQDPPRDAAQQAHPDTAADPLQAARREQLHAMRRLHENLGRRWTFTADAWIGNRLSYSGRTADPGQAYRGYSQLELDYRLATQAGSSESSLSLFGRVFASSGVDNGVWPIRQPTLGIGLRWKPLNDQVLYLTLEPLIPVGDRSGRSHDVLVRASASFLNEGEHSDDWHPNDKAWLARSLYLDLAHYLRDERTSVTADLRGSYHWKLGEGRSLEPYAHLQYSGIHYRALDRYDSDVRAGVGVRLNQWSGASRYDAYPTRTSVGLELQHAFRSFLSEREVVIATLRGRW